MIVNSLVPKEKLSIHWIFSLPTYGYTAGVLGVIWRIVMVILTSILMAKLGSDSSSNLYPILLKYVLYYLLLTLVANVLFIAAIIKKWAYVLLPYLAVQGIEVVEIIFVLISGCYVFKAVDSQIEFWLLLLISSSILVIQGWLFYQSVRLFRDMEITVAVRELQKQTPIHIDRMEKV